ncbi:MAG: hypothetical protein QXY62_00470 [Candidatus Altiarchaeota archaeon]
MKIKSIENMEIIRLFLGSVFLILMLSVFSLLVSAGSSDSSLILSKLTVSSMLSKKDDGLTISSLGIKKTIDLNEELSRKIESATLKSNNPVRRIGGAGATWETKEDKYKRYRQKFNSAAEYALDSVTMMVGGIKFTKVTVPKAANKLFSSSFKSTSHFSFSFPRELTSREAAEELLITRNAEHLKNAGWSSLSKKLIVKTPTTVVKSVDPFISARKVNSWFMEGDIVVPTP